MARPLRIEHPDAWYYVMNRGRRRENVFHDRKDYLSFLEILGKCFEMFELEIHTYALVPNHYHLLVRTPPDREKLTRSARITYDSISADLVKNADITRIAGKRVRMRRKVSDTGWGTDKRGQTNIRCHS